MITIRLFLIMIVCFLLSACTKNKNANQSSSVWHHKNVKKTIDVAFQQEAMLIDVPIPLYDERIAVYSQETLPESNSIILGYRSSLDLQNIVRFYTGQMDRLGWQQIKVFSGLESLLQFESPDRLCTVSIRPSAKKRGCSDIIIFIGVKEKGDLSPFLLL